MCHREAGQYEILHREWRSILISECRFVCSNCGMILGTPMALCDMYGSWVNGGVQNPVAFGYICSCLPETMSPEEAQGVGVSP